MMLKHELALELKRLISDTGAYDKRNRWLYLNYLWYNPDVRKSYRNIVAEFILGNTHLNSESVLLVLESAASTYGLVPVVSFAADKLGCKLSIWREILPVSISESWLLPSRLEKGKKCVIMQGVVSKGTMLRRVAEDIMLVDWKVDGFISLIKDDVNINYFNASLTHFKNNLGITENFFDLSLLNFSELS